MRNRTKGGGVPKNDRISTRGKEQNEMQRWEKQKGSPHLGGILGEKESMNKNTPYHTSPYLSMKFNEKRADLITVWRIARGVVTTARQKDERWEKTFTAGTPGGAGEEITKRTVSQVERENLQTFLKEATSKSLKPTSGRNLSLW